MILYWRVLEQNAKSTKTMKQGWEIKKLGAVCTLIADGDWIESRHQSDDGIRLIQTGNIGNGVFKAKDDKPHYISESTFVELGCTEIFAGDCLVSRLPDPVGRACIIPETNCRMITAVDCSIIRFNSDIVSKFFIYYTQCEKYRRDIDNNTTGTTRKRISRKNLESISIPVPPIAEQERIVSELDCLSGVIEKKREQLKQLDALAQSIFYEMFGDPITNEKGWEIKKLGEVGKVITGNTPSTKDEENYSSNDYCFVKPSDIGKDYVTKIENTEFYISEKAFSQSRRLSKGFVLTTCIGIIGKVGILKVDATCNQQINAILPDENSVSEYVAWAIYLTRSVLENIANAPVVPIINKGEFSNILIPLPPKALQQEFADKIETIEKQKELIKESIKETETLFNARMDYYFN